MEEFGGDYFTKLGAGVAAVAAGAYGVFRLFKSDRREDKTAALTDSAMMQVIQTLREEVARLSERLEKVEAANADCELKNLQLHMEIVELKKQMSLS
jgi:hypothetical protein